MVRKMAYVGFSYLLGLLFASFFCFEIKNVFCLFTNACAGGGLYDIIITKEFGKE